MRGVRDRVERGAGVREDRRRVSGAWRVWPGVTQRRAGQIEPGTDSSSSVPGPSSHRRATLSWSQAAMALAADSVSAFQSKSTRE